MVNQADDNGKIIRFVPLDHGQKVTGFTGARLYYPPRSDNTYGDYVTGVESDGAWDFTIPMGVLNAGRVECNLAFVDGDGETYSRNVVFLVEPAVSGVFDPGDGQQTRIDKVIGTVQDTADTAIGSVNKTASDAVESISKAEESISKSVTDARASADAAANTPDVTLIYGFYSNDLQDSYTDTKPATDLPEGTDMTNAYKTLQSSERILFTETTLGVEIMDCTGEVWALGKGLTVSGMVHPNAEGAVKLGQILGRKLEQLLTQSTPTESPNLYVAPSLPQTIKGITFSDAGNGGIYCKGTGNGYAILPSDTLTLQAGTYSVSPNEDVYMELFRGSVTVIDKSNPVKSIPAGNYTPKLVVVKGKPIDETVYPRLVRIDQ